MTLEQVLAHRAGLPSGNDPGLILDRGIVESTKTVHQLRQILVASQLSRDPTTPPGSKWTYSNVGYIIVGAALEKVTGGSWEDLMREHIFRPLGITSGGFGAPGTAGKVDQPTGALLVEGSGAENDAVHKWEVSYMTRSQSAFAPLSLLLNLLARQNLTAEPGCIQGKVLDATGAPVPSIHVIATSANQRVSVELQTDTDGFFMPDQVLAAEEYEVLASDNPVVPNVSSAIKPVGAVQAIAGTENQCPSVMLLQPALAHLRVKATDDAGVKQLKEKMGFESTEFSGRVIRALYDDPNMLTLSGKTIITAEAAERYGISDLDGYEPKSLRGIYGGPHPAFDIQ